jgi:hypothetical protein
VRVLVLLASLENDCPWLSNVVVVGMKTDFDWLIITKPHFDWSISPALFSCLPAPRLLNHQPVIFLELFSFVEL